MKSFLITSGLFLSLVIAVSAQNNEVSFVFQHKIGAEYLKLNESVFPVWNGKKVKISRAAFYMAEMALKQGTTEIPLSDRYVLVDAAFLGKAYSLGTWPVQNCDGIALHLGVDQAHNHLDPATYPTEHPLALQNPSMHWGWASGYRFMAIEGKVDNDGDGEPETLFQFHNLGDALYKSLELTGAVTAVNGKLTVTFILDYVKLFNNMTMTGSLIAHGSAAANQQMMNNAASGGFISLAQTTDVQAPAEVPVTLSPNPSSGETVFQVLGTVQGRSRLAIFDFTGKQVYEQTASDAQSFVFETGSWNAGAYACLLFDQNGRLIARKSLVVE